MDFGLISILIPCYRFFPNFHPNSIGYGFLPNIHPNTIDFVFWLNFDPNTTDYFDPIFILFILGLSILAKINPNTIYYGF